MQAQVSKVWELMVGFPMYSEEEAYGGLLKMKMKGSQNKGY